MNARLLADIAAFQSKHRLGDHRFGILAARNGRLVDRLKRGRRIWPETEALIRGFMLTYAKDKVGRYPKDRAA